MTKPLLRWIGGKSRLVEILAKAVPEDLDVYMEPFCGSAALFFHLYSTGRLHGCKVILSDINPHLIGTYQAVRAQPAGVAEEVERHISLHSKEYYYELRAAWNEHRHEMDHHVLAGHFIYLNHANFNGLYRVNRKGDFNVPCGKPKVTFDIERIFEVSDALQGVELMAGAYLDVFDKTYILSAHHLHKFVYVDPPYLVGPNNGFTSYSTNGFSAEDHQRLAARLAILTDFNIHVLASNSLEAKPLYSGVPWLAEEVETSYSVSRKATSRGYVKELLVRSNNLQASPS